MMAEQGDLWGQLLAAANAGDARAYAKFLHTVTPVLRGIVRAKGDSFGAAGCEDVLQEVLLAIHLKRHTWDPGSPVRPWLYAITRYKVIDAFRDVQAAAADKEKLQNDAFTYASRIVPEARGEAPSLLPAYAVERVKY